MTFARLKGSFPELLPQNALIKTSGVDQAAWNFHPLLGLIQRLRFRLIVALLRERRFHRLLEIGYGSGVFMPELARHCDQLYGIDIHRNARPVLDRLRGHDVATKLLSGSASALPFGENVFDCIVAVSAVEYFEPLDAACLEINRVLRADGCFVLVTPGHSPIVDLGLKILTGINPKDEYRDRRQRMMSTLLKYFIVQQRLTAPSWRGAPIRLYRGLRLGVSK